MVAATICSHRAAQELPQAAAQVLSGVRSQAAGTSGAKVLSGNDKNNKGRLRHRKRPHSGKEAPSQVPESPSHPGIVRGPATQAAAPAQTECWPLECCGQVAVFGNKNEAFSKLSRWKHPSQNPMDARARTPDTPLLATAPTAPFLFTVSVRFSIRFQVFRHQLF